MIIIIVSVTIFTCIIIIAFNYNDYRLVQETTIFIIGFFIERCLENMKQEVKGYFDIDRWQSVFCNLHLPTLSNTCYLKPVI